MPAKRKATDDELRAAFIRLRSAKKTAEELGMNRGTVTAHLARLGLTRRNRKWAGATAKYVCESCALPFETKYPRQSEPKRYCSRICSLLSTAANPDVRKKRAAAAALRCGPLHPRWIDDRRLVLQSKRASSLLHSMIRRLLGKAGPRRSAEFALGYSLADFRERIESQFMSGMTWQNHGQFGWHVDHKRPISDFPLDASPKEVNALSNLQPLWWQDNLRKGGVRRLKGMGVI